jgi:predicted DNA binding CopG/RHH family protein
MGKKMIPDPPFLDEEERDLMESFGEGKWIPLEGTELREQALKLRKAAAETIAASGLKTERMNIRMSAADLRALKRRAYREGIPYQTLVASVLHKYGEGRLVDVDEARRVLQTPGSPRKSGRPIRRTR